MTRKGDMTGVHSNAEALEDGRLRSPAAERNEAAIVAALAPHVPETGRVLEIASGTGQHAVAMARAYPGLDWQPTDIAPERLASIDAWRAAQGVANMRVAAYLDATTPDWTVVPVEMVFFANLMHLLAEPAAARVLRGAARALAPGGVLCAYGPFRVNGAFRSVGDENFDAALRRADPATGYKDLDWVDRVVAEAGLVRRAWIDMPANNLILVAQKP